MRAEVLCVSLKTCSGRWKDVMKWSQRPRFSDTHSGCWVHRKATNNRRFSIRTSTMRPRAGVEDEDRRATHRISGSPRPASPAFDDGCDLPHQRGRPTPMDFNLFGPVLARWSRFRRIPILFINWETLCPDGLNTETDVYVAFEGQELDRTMRVCDPDGADLRLWIRWHQTRRR